MFAFLISPCFFFFLLSQYFITFKILSILIQEAFTKEPSFLIRSGLSDRKTRHCLHIYWINQKVPSGFSIGRMEKSNELFGQPNAWVC